MREFQLNQFPTSCGRLLYCCAPQDKSHFEMMKNESPDLIYNLASELDWLVPMEREVSKEVMLLDIDDYSIPDYEEIFKMQMDYICSMLKHNKTAIVHCLGGHGRTSMVLACILVYLGDLDSEKAIDLTRTLPSRGPETRQQCEFVRKFESYIIQ